MIDTRTACPGRPRHAYSMSRPTGRHVQLAPEHTCAPWFFCAERANPEDLLAGKTIPDMLSKTLAFFTQEQLVATTKTEVVSVRVPPDVKAALVAAAEQERRSLASMVEFMVLDYCRSRGIEVKGAVDAAKVPKRLVKG